MGGIAAVMLMGHGRYLMGAYDHIRTVTIYNLVIRMHS